MAADRNFGLRWFRHVRAQGRVGTAAIVMDCPFKEDAPEMLLAERDHEIRTFPPNGPSQGFAVGVCRRAANRRFQYSDTETGQFVIQAHREDCIPVVNHESIRMIAG